jgi:predicted SnoaL-like aldol condensation-catalyzing enzyme
MRELVELFNQRRPIEVERYFAPTFRLRQPNGPNREGLAGARDMIDGLFALGEQAQLTILAIVEEGDHIAVRWQVDGMTGCATAAMMAMYRFEAGRIVDDWGIAVVAPWPE